jgi:hypothetical protein
MPIRPFLPGQAFDPDVISEMSQALTEACDELGLHRIDDAATRLVAEKIIRLAQRGIRGAVTLQMMAVEEVTRE